ncbi:MAG: hypothetical protein WD766_04600 [Gemmatimonadota bacterium]
MKDPSRLDYVELTPQEYLSVQGGTDPLRYVAFLTACFGAGFTFGYEKLGPALFG